MSDERSSGACQCVSQNGWWTRLIARRPWILIGLSIGLLVASIVTVAVLGVLNELPKLADPAEAFQTIGTELSGRSIQHKNLLTNTDAWFPGSRIFKRSANRENLEYCYENMGQNIQYMARFVVSSKLDLLSLEALQAMCRLEVQIMSHSEAYMRCYSSDDPGAQCCPSWSLPNFVARFANKSGCRKLTQENVDIFRDTLSNCLPYLLNKTLSDCWTKQNAMRLCNVPSKCQSILLYQTTRFFLPTSIIETTSLVPFHKTMFFLPLYLGDRNLALYDLIIRSLNVQQDTTPKNTIKINKSLKIEGIYFGIKLSLFNRSILNDLIWLAFGVASIFIIICIVTESIILGMVTMVIIGLSLVDGFLIYRYILQISYFPFINLMTSILALAIGADDVFIYKRVWLSCKSDTREATLEKMVSDTLRHASLSIIVTSISTAAALYVNYISRIVAVKCFAIYAGTAILVNLFLMLTCVPAFVIVLDANSTCKCCSRSTSSSTSCSSCLKGLEAKCKKLFLVFQQAYSACIFKGPQYIIVRFRYIWLAVFLLMVIGSMVVTFQYPGLSFPNSAYKPIFKVHHPTEIYEQQKQLFAFEVDSEKKYKKVAYFIFGAIPEDNRNQFDPTSPSLFVPDTTLNLTSKAAQRWLIKFCSEFQSMPYLISIPSSNCPFDSLYGSIQQYQILECSNNKNSLCCSTKPNNTFPMNSADFIGCLKEYLSASGKMHTYLYRFNSQKKLVGLIIMANTNVSYNANYLETKAYYSRVNDWFQAKMESVPFEMSKGYFSSDFFLYDLNKNISEYLPINMFISVLVAGVVIFLNTLNIWLTLCSMIAILTILSSVIAFLILMGWKVDIVESIIITLAIGLAVDYCVHFVVAYRITTRAPPNSYTRIERTKSALNKVVTPILAGAFTTALSALSILPSNILAYNQMAMCLLVLTGVAVFFALVILPAMLSIVGPEQDSGQFFWPTCCSSQQLGEDRKDKTVYSGDGGSNNDPCSIQPKNMSNQEISLVSHDDDNLEQSL